METQSKEPPDPTTLARNGKIIQILGLMDVVLGALLPFVGPFAAPDMGAYWWFAGGFLALVGLGLVVYGRVMQKQGQPQSRTVVR